MSEKLGALTVWALFLGLCHVVASPAIPFVISAVALGIFTKVLFGALRGATNGS
jgi:hypothetical protein